MSGPASPLTLAVEPSASDAVRWLVGQAEAELEVRYGALAESELALSVTEFDLPAGAFVVARADGRLVGGAGVRPVAPKVAEVKRLWTDPARRGRGVARTVMAELESVAADLGYTALWLATGTRQPEAVAFYATTG
jgi:GNAT superfamily N-acetyltransferase